MILQDRAGIPKMLTTLLMIDEGLWILLFLLEEGENKLVEPHPLSAIPMNYSNFQSIQNFMMH